MPHKQSPDIVFFGIVWTLSSIAGIAAMLRTNQTVTKRIIWMSLLNSGCFGLGVALWLHNKLDPFQLLAVSIFAGLGGMSVIEIFFRKIAKRME